MERKLAFMTIRHLKIFIAVADTGKMSLAAQQLYISQPTVSQAIGEIEQYYGVQLFERLSRKLYITKAGEKLLGYARHIVSLFDEMELELKYTAENLSLHVGATITIGICLLTGIVNRYEAAHPHVNVNAYIDNTRVIEEMILKSELDLGLVEGTIKNSDIVTLPFVQDELVLICGNDHPLAQRKRVRAQELQGQAFALREKGSGTRALFERYLQEKGITVSEKWECHSSETIKNAVMGGQGLSVISRRLVARQAAEGTLRILPIEDAKLTRQFSLIHHKNKFLSEPIRDFMESVQQTE